MCGCVNIIDMEYLILFLVGLAVGSFLNVVIYRLKLGDSPIKGRSYCDFCHKKIAWFDNVPLISFLFLRGKCRQCHKKIPMDYPLVELLVGLQFVWVYWLLSVNFHFFNSWEGSYSLALLLYWLILFSGSLVIAIYDLKYMVIPDEILWPLVVISFSRLFVSHQWQVVPVAFASMAFIMSLWLLTRKKGMGFGDIKLAFLMGLVLGYPRIIVALMIAFLTGAVVGVILLLLRIKKFKSKIAFGPFLLLGMLVAKLYGYQIWQWYFGLL